MGTKLSLDYDIISGPWGNTCIQTKIGGKPEKLPFEYEYFKESSVEVLSVLGKNYNVSKYKDIEINENSTFEFKKHLLNYGFSVREANLPGITIHNSIYKYVNLSFLPKPALTKNDLEGKVKGLIRKYIVTTYIKHGPIMGGFRFNGDDGIGPRLSSEETITKNYFEERKNKKDELKERQLEQIIEYAQAILNNSKFSLKDLEKMVSNESIAV